MQRTEEQQIAVDLGKQPGHLKINAYAGSGKTTTCLMLAEEIRMPMLYLCFNKSIAEEAARKFPAHVACSTQHSFAYRAVGGKFGHNKDKLFKSLYAKETAEILGVKAVQVFNGTHTLEPSTVAYCVNQTVKKFCQSGDAELSDKHYIPLDAFDGYEPEDKARMRHTVTAYAVRLWAMMADPNSRVPLGHDGYLKFWERSNPRINTGKILLDEAQDTNGVMLSVLEQQTNADIIFVGDKYQQIYEWRGAVNAMALFPDARTCRLTQSFRFGNAIAEKGTALLRLLGEPAEIRGNPAIESRFSGPNLIPDMEGKITRISRTNATILSYLVDSFLDDESAENIYVAGGVADIISMIDAGWDLQQGKKPRHNLFMGFKDWAEFENYCKKTRDPEANSILRVFSEHGPAKAKKALMLAKDTEHGADVILTTAHKAKGREWPNVVLEDDFNPQPGEDGLYNASEMRLLYVACTRAINMLAMPDWLYALGEE